MSETCQCERAVYFQIKRNVRLRSSTTECKSYSNTAKVCRAATISHNLSSHMIQKKKMLDMKRHLKIGPSLYNAFFLNNENLTVNKTG